MNAGCRSMTDNEIIKALGCCIEHKCHKCPARAMFCSESIPMAFALDLINRIREENEALINGQETLQKYIAKKDAEIERLKGWQDLLKAEKHSLIKAEAIKEFAERLKEKGNRSLGDHFITKWIDDLVKEMVGDV